MADSFFYEDFYYFRKEALFSLDENHQLNILIRDKWDSQHFGPYDFENNLQDRNYSVIGSSSDLIDKCLLERLETSGYLLSYEMNPDVFILVLDDFFVDNFVSFSS